MELGLKGKVALITGGSEGIGRATALCLAREGAIVSICARRAEPLAAVEKELLATGATVFAFQGDATNAEQMQQWVKQVHDTFGKIDILVNNAGGSGQLSFDDVDEARWQEDVSVKLFAPMRLIRLVLPYMKAQKSGSIINIGSMSGRIVNWPFRHAAYNVSKAGVHMLTKCLATEWAEFNIRVNALAPGYIRTELTEEVLREHPDVVNNVWAKGAVQNRIGSVEELVGATVYLASDAASFTTGEVITIDGGLTLR